MEPHKSEDYHNFLIGYWDIFTKDVFQTKDYTFRNLKDIFQAKDVVTVSGKKDSSVVKLNKKDHIAKIENMIKQGIS